MCSSILTVFFATIAVAACADINDINTDYFSTTSTTIMTNTKNKQKRMSPTTMSTHTNLAQNPESFVSCINTLNNYKNDSVIKSAFQPVTKSLLDDLLNILPCNMTLKIEEIEGTGNVTKYENRAIFWTENTKLKNASLEVDIITVEGDKKKFSITGANCEFQYLYKVVLSNNSETRLILVETEISECEETTIPDEILTFQEMWSLMRLIEDNFHYGVKIREKILLKCFENIFFLYIP